MMGAPLFRLAGRLLNTPLLIHPAKAEIIFSVLSGRLGFAGTFADMQGSENQPGSLSDALGSGRSVSPSSSDGIAVIPVLDTLVNRGAWLDSQSGMTSYEGIAAQVQEAAADPTIRAMVLDIASPGGEAGGMAGLAELIRSVRETKPVTAVVNDMAASAAYGIASAASEIVISPTSILGSIGVVMLHADHSGELAAQGVKPTLIFAGAHKVDGNPFEPLSDAVRADLQESVDAHYLQFLETVALGRGRRLTAAMARATEARTFIGTEAIRLGLADRVASLDEVLAALSQATPTPSSRPMGRIARKGGPDMTHDEREPAVEALVAPLAAEATPPPSLSATADSMALHEALAAARLEERSRIRLIVHSPEALGRTRQALVLATETALSIAEAEKILAASPKEIRIEALAERASAGTEFGASQEPSRPHPKLQSEEGWQRAVANANRRFVRT